VAFTVPLLLGCVAPAAAAHPLPKQTRALVLRVEFPEREALGAKRRFTNEAGNGLVDRLVSYFDEVSRRRFHIEARVSDKVYRLPQPRASYVSRPRDMLRDALAAAYRPEPEGEKRLIDTLQPEVLIVYFAGAGAESDMNKKFRRRLPWSNAVSSRNFLRAGPHRLSYGIVVGVDPLMKLSAFGVSCHEFGHLLDWPELYAPNKAHEGIGVWGLMGQGTWVGMGDQPPHPSAYAKLRAGWVDARIVEKSEHIELPSVERSGEVVKIFARGPEHPHEYFLIENRERRGFDRSIRGEGLLIWHIDEHQSSFRRSQDIPHHKRVDLLTADSWPSHLDIGHSRGGNRGDSGDPWAARPDGPGPDTKPGTGSYDGTPGRFAIRNISTAGPVMSFDVVFGDGITTNENRTDKLSASEDDT
jgi:M6 family metalloprotease-like protein